MLRIQATHTRIVALEKQGITTTWGMTNVSVVQMKVTSPKVKGKAGKLKMCSAESFGVSTQPLQGDHC